MQFKSIIIAVLSLGVTLIPSASAERPATWNDKLQLWDIGKVGWLPNDKKTPVKDAGSCGGRIKEGGWACGRFGPGFDVNLRVIYYCSNGRLRKRETCNRDSKNNMCVKNSRRKWKAFYPFVTSEQLVCVKRKDALK